MTAAAQVLSELEGKAKSLCEMEDFYFAQDKEAKKKALRDSIGESVQTLLQKGSAGQQELSPGEKARAFYLKGKVCMSSPTALEQQKAEELLSKAAKLDPSLATAWTALGELYYEKREMQQARRSFEQALEYGAEDAENSKEAKADALRKLSMVLRGLEAETPEARGENFTLALTKAKEATALDPADGSSWEVLGNSYLGDFFVNGTMKPEVLQKALVAFERAQASYAKQGKETPFLYHNWGIALKYMENYELAIQTFRRAMAISPEATPAAREAQQLSESVSKIADLCRNQGHLKPKRLKSITSSIPPTAGKSLVELKAGENTDELLGAKVVSILQDREKEVPCILVCCDAQTAFFSLSVYNADLAALSAAVNPGETTLSVKNPYFRSVSVSLSSPDGASGPTTCTYPSIRVAHPGDLLAGGGNLGSAAVVSAFKTGTTFAEAGA